MSLSRMRVILPPPLVVPVHELNVHAEAPCNLYLDTDYFVHSTANDGEPLGRFHSVMPDDVMRKMNTAPSVVVSHKSNGYVLSPPLLWKCASVIEPAEYGSLDTDYYVFVHSVTLLDQLA